MRVWEGHRILDHMTQEFTHRLIYEQGFSLLAQTLKLPWTISRWSQDKDMRGFKEDIVISSVLKSID